MRKICCFEALGSAVSHKSTKKSSATWSKHFTPRNFVKCFLISILLRKCFYFHQKLFDKTASKII